MRFDKLRAGVLAVNTEDERNLRVAVYPGLVLRDLELPNTAANRERVVAAVTDAIDQLAWDVAPELVELTEEQEQPTCLTE